MTEVSSAEIAALRAVAEAARNRDGCDEHCQMMTPYRGCTCGNDELQAAISDLDAIAETTRDGNSSAATGAGR